MSEDGRLIHVTNKRQPRGVCREGVGVGVGYGWVKGAQ